MALRASEILLILRAKNQASMTIRRVAKDVQFLGRTIKANEPGLGTLGMGRRASVAGAAMTHVGGAAALAGGAALAGLGAASKSFADFDTMASQAATQIGNINNSVEDVVANTARLRNEILDMMGDFPATAQEMSNAAFEIFSSADVPFQRGIDLMELFNETAVAGMTDLETATDGAMTVLNNFGDPAGPIGRSKDLMNDMFSIIRFGRVDLATLNTMMNQIAPAAAAADQKLSDVGGAIATLTRRLGPEIASAGLARLFEIFQRKDFQAGMAKAGAAITDVSGKLLPLPEIMKQIMSLGPRPGRTLQNLIQTVTAFGAGKGQGIQATVQARRALVTLVKFYKDYIDIQDRSIRNNNQFEKQLAANLQASGVRWAKFSNRVRANILRIGEDAIPVFEDIGNFIEPAIKWWEELDRSTKTSIVATTGAVAAYALLGGVIVGLVGITTGIIGAFTMIAGVIMNKLIPALGAARASAIALGASVRMSMAAFTSAMLIGGTGVLGRITAIGAGLRSIAASLAAIGPHALFAIGITMAFTGDGWTSLIGKMLMGAGLGASVGGLPGAIVGGSIVVLVHIVRDSMSGGGLEDLTDTELEKWKDLGKEAGTTYGLESAKAAEAILRRRRAARSSTLPLGSIGEIAAEAGKISIPRTGEDVVRGITDNIRKVNRVTKQGLFSNAMTIDQLNKQVENQLKASNKTLEDWAKQRANVMEQATEEADNILQSAVSNLESTYDEFLQANESAMGQLFQGPWLTGETFNLAQEWGITPAIQDLNRDLREQLKQFNTWQQSLRAIGSRGAPTELVKMLESLGPDAVDKLEVLRKASPKMFAQFISLWKKRQNVVKKETQIDFNAQLAQWNKYGKDIAFQIVAGLRSENIQLQQGFERYITGNFSGALQKIKDEALAEFYKENPEARAAEKNAAAIKRQAAVRRQQIINKQADTYNIYQQPGESDAAFAKRVAWEAAQRKGRGKTPAKKIPQGKKISPDRKVGTIRGGD